MARQSKGVGARARKAKKRWDIVVRQYRRRHQMWVMEMLPTMPDAQWKAYEQWVATFGGMNQRKFKRTLRATRSPQ